MRAGLLIRPAAESDVDELAAFIARHSQAQAIRFYRAVEARYRQIHEHPQQWPLYQSLDHPRLSGLRRSPVVGFPSHLIFYRAAPEVVEIIRVFHGARDVRALLAELTE